MAVRNIVIIGDEVLRKTAEPVPRITKRISKLIKDMLDTMYAFDGVGLAAPQIGISKRIIVIDVGEGPLVLVNPVLLDSHGEEVDVEGCLSIPDKRFYVKRATHVEVSGLDEKGRTVRLEAEGLLARALQHEMDHLDGILIVDRMISEVAVSSGNETVEEEGV